MREMLEAGVHFGHQARYWNPKMAPYLFGQRNKIHIINLEKTLPLYNEAVGYISKVAARKGTVLFVGTKRAAQTIIQEEANRCDMPFVNRRWLGGLLTNFKTVKKSINRLKKLEEMMADGSLEKMSKKDLLRHKREQEKLERSVSGIKDMPGIPQAIFIVDVGYENIAISEARKLGIPVIGVVDSNNSPDCVDYIIPGNDDAIRSIRLYAKGVADAILDGRQSIAHIGGTEAGDEFVELDESGDPIIPVETEQTPKVAVKKKSIKKKISKPVADENSDEASVVEAVETEPEKATEARKKITKKKVTKKKLSKPVTDEKSDEASAVEAEPEKATKAKKKIAKNKVTKKKATKKTTATKATEEVGDE